MSHEGSELPKDLRSGPLLPLGAEHGARRLLVIALSHSSEDLAALVQDLVALQLEHPDVKPILLVGPEPCAELRAAQLVYETCLSEQEWLDLGTARSYRDYLRARVQDARDLYRPDAVSIAVPGVPPDLGLPL